MEGMTLEEFEKARNKKPAVLSKKEKFLAKCPEEERPYIEAYINKLEVDKANNKEKAKQLATLTNEYLNTGVINLGDDIELTMGEMLIMRAGINSINNPKLSFRDINEAQKVIDNDTKDQKGTTNIVFVTNGQDLGE